MAVNIGTLIERLQDAQVAGVDRLADVRIVGPGSRRYLLAEVSVEDAEDGSDILLAIERPED